LQAALTSGLAALRLALISGPTPISGPIRPLLRRSVLAGLLPPGWLPRLGLGLFAVLVARLVRLGLFAVLMARLVRLALFAVLVLVARLVRLALFAVLIAHLVQLAPDRSRHLLPKLGHRRFERLPDLLLKHLRELRAGTGIRLLSL